MGMLQYYPFLSYFTKGFQIYSFCVIYFTEFNCGQVNLHWLNMTDLGKYLHRPVSLFSSILIIQNKKKSSIF